MPVPTGMRPGLYGPGAFGMTTNVPGGQDIQFQLEDLENQIADITRGLQGGQMGASKWRRTDQLWQLMSQRAGLQARLRAQEMMPGQGWQQGQVGQGWPPDGGPQFYGFGAEDVAGFEAGERERLMDQVASAMAARGMSISSQHIDLAAAAAAQARQYALPYMERQFGRKTDWEMARWQQQEHAQQFEQQMQFRRQQMALEAQLRRSAMRQQWEMFTSQLEAQDFWRLQEQAAAAEPGALPPQAPGPPAMRSGIPSEFYMGDPGWMSQYYDWHRRGPGVSPWAG